MRTSILRILNLLRGRDCRLPSLHILDVGHGNSAVLVDKRGVVVIDAGKASDLLHFLECERITVVDSLLLSHADADHIGGTIGLLASETVQVRRVYLNTDSLKGTDIWEDLLTALQDHQKRGEVRWEIGLTPQRNGTLDCGEVALEILAPSQYIAAKGPGGRDSKNRKLTSNSLSAVVKLVHNGVAVAMLPGDIDMVGLENLLGDHEDIRAWLTVFPHHGRGAGGADITDFTSRFCTAVKPAIVVFSVGRSEADVPTPAVLACVDGKLAMVRMLTTGSSESMQHHIDVTASTLHRDCVGNVVVHLGRRTLDVECQNA